MYETQSRKELKETVVKLTTIILQKNDLEKLNVEEAHENQKDFKKTASATS